MPNGARWQIFSKVGLASRIDNLRDDSNFITAGDFTTGVMDRGRKRRSPYNFYTLIQVNYI